MLKKAGGGEIGDAKENHLGLLSRLRAEDESEGHRGYGADPVPAVLPQVQGGAPGEHHPPGRRCAGLIGRNEILPEQEKKLHPTGRDHAGVLTDKPEPEATSPLALLQAVRV